MEKLFEAGLAKKSEYDCLKELFTLCFEDSIEAVNAFFEKTVSPERVVVIFDGNKAVNSADALDILKHATGSKQLDAKKEELGDYNGDGKVNSFDALTVLQVATGSLKYD